MTRLTKDIRDTIANNCALEQFKEQKELLIKEEHSLGMELYTHLFGELKTANGVKILNAIGKIPENWFRMDKCLRFNCDGYNLVFNVSKPVRVPNTDGFCRPLGSITGKLAEKAQAYANKKEQCNDQYKEARRALRLMLDSFGTIKQLRTGWPEGEKFYNSYSDDVTAPALPAVQIESVNKLLGLAK
jgi:hypothetical protein